MSSTRCEVPLVLLLALGASPVASAQVASVVVTATRMPQPSADLPMSVDRVDHDRIADGELRVNLSETLDAIPGVVAQNRQNYAQDLQLSVRGFGARSSFGVRGVRLYADGIPGTMPDGQGQFSHFDLGSADRIEVLRGPFSALYGNSSGGVIAIFTEDGKQGSEIAAGASGGSFGLRRYSLRADGAGGALNYVADASHFELDGDRDHSAAERNDFNSKLRIDLGERAKLTFVANAIETPFVQDPLGLTRAQWLANPSQAGTNALLYDTRKSLTQAQGGVTYTRSLDDDGEFAATAYAGHRRTIQYQAILASAQAARATHPGGVIDLGRDYSGIDVHATKHYLPAETPLAVTLGAMYDTLAEARRGYLNYIGAQLGVEGDERRDETNHVHDFDQYLEVQWQPGDRWRAIGGVRHSVVDVSSLDNLAAVAVPATTGARYAATNPVAGLSFRAMPNLHLYGSYGKGFETPTLNDLAYRSCDGSVPGLNIGLKAARSDNYEVGLKADRGALAATVAAFDIVTRDELAVATNCGGRSVFQNVEGTRRRGAELALTAVAGSEWTARLAYTYLRAVTSSAYTTCVGIPCTAVNIPAGSRLPAVPASTLYSSLAWHPVPDSFVVEAEVINRAQIYFDDRNSDAAPGYWALNAHATLRQRLSRWRLEEMLRVENLSDRRYAGTVIVNESNGRFLEPAPGRAFYVGITAAFGP